MSLEERKKLPEPRPSEPIPSWAVDPEFRRRQGRELARRIGAEQGPDEAARALAALEEEIEADEARWREYLASKPRATA